MEKVVIVNEGAEVKDLQIWRLQVAILKKTDSMLLPHMVVGLYDNFEQHF